MKHGHDLEKLEGRMIEMWATVQENTRRIEGLTKLVSAQQKEIAELKSKPTPALWEVS